MKKLKKKKKSTIMINRKNITPALKTRTDVSVF